MWSLFLNEATTATNEDYCDFELKTPRKISVVTGEAAYPLIKNIVDIATEKWHNLYCNVYAAKNKFFGGHITVTGLVTGSDIIAALKGKDIGDELLISASMLRHEKDKFLDDLTPDDVQKELGVKIKITENDGFEFVSALLGNR